MGSLSNSNPNPNPNPNPWTPKDCSSGICSIYCPEWCYVVYPPPPPSRSLFQFSPLIVALIGILATALILLTYYTLVSRLCRHTAAPRDPPQENTPQPNHGLDHSLIDSISVRKYTKGGGGGAHARDCSVCLSEFMENERVRVLPRCNHAFHLPCIDTWLNSNATCPLCRSSVILLASASAC